MPKLRLIFIIDFKNLHITAFVSFLTFSFSMVACNNGFILLLKRFGYFKSLVHLFEFQKYFSTERVNALESFGLKQISNGGICD